jgi:hypothetical protein
MEFQVTGEDRFCCNDGTEEILIENPEDSGEVNIKTEPVMIECHDVEKAIKKSTTRNSDMDSSKVEDESMNRQRKRSGSLTSGGETDTDELHSSEIIDSGGNRFRQRKKRKNKFDNPLKNLVHKLNSSQINLEDTFHTSLDEVDSFLNKFGVRTLNMDMLTPQQFSDFIERFGSSLQPV